MQIAQIPVVLEAFLKLMRRQHVKQVTRFRTFGQLFSCQYHPVLSDGSIARNCVEHLAGFNVGDGSVESVRFFVECLDRIQVMIGCLADGVQLGHRIGIAQHRLLHSGVEQIAAPQLHPGHQCTLVIVQLGIRPADTEQAPCLKTVLQAVRAAKEFLRRLAARPAAARSPSRDSPCHAATSVPR